MLPGNQHDLRNCFLLCKKVHHVYQKIKGIAEPFFSILVEGENHKFVLDLYFVDWLIWLKHLTSGASLQIIKNVAGNWGTVL